jgi:tricorn protease
MFIQSASHVKRFWTVAAGGGPAEPMELARGYQGQIAADGRHIAYRMNTSWDEERCNYRGGQNRPIWIVDLQTWDLESSPASRGRSSTWRRRPSPAPGAARCTGTG